MIKFLNKVALFFALMAFIDVICGFSFKYLREHAIGGETQKNYYIAEKCCDDILVLGSSRAARHYDSKVIEDSFGLTCYNCGEPGCGIITAYARYKMIEQRHKPKIVVYEVSPNYDYFRTDDYSKYLGRIRQYSDNPEVKKLNIELGDAFERVRLFSNMYRNNSFLIHNMIDNFLETNYYNGFEPLYGTLKKDAPKKSSISLDYAIDSLKLSYMEKLIVDLKMNGISVFFVASPKFISSEEAINSSSEYSPVFALCEQYDVPFLYHTYLEGVSNNRELFQDYVHLNEKGAKSFTEYICSELKDNLPVE